MQTIILTAPVTKDTQRKVKEIAQANKIPIRVLCAMLIENGLKDIAEGKKEIAQPAIMSQPAQAMNYAAKQSKIRIIK